MTKILIVDDTATNLLLLELFLQKLHCETVAFSDVDECLRWSADNISSIDLAILDYQMPKMNGDQLSIHLAELGMNGNCILLTAYSGLSQSMLCTEANIKAIMNKPISLQDLRYALSRWSDKSRENDARIEKRETLLSEVEQEAYVFNGAAYSAIQATLVNHSHNGLAFKVSVLEANLIKLGSEIIFKDGNNYSIRWSRLDGDSMIFGACRINT